METSSGIAAIKNFFNAGTSRPVQATEIMEFWKACTTEEKDQFKREIARWDGHSEFITAVN